jgi:hypothetical protein
VPPGDVRDDDVQPGAVREHRVDEGRRQVDPAPGGLEHLLHQVADLAVVEDRGGELGAAALGDEDPPGLVDPDLLDRRIVQWACSGPKPATES